MILKYLLEEKFIYNHIAGKENTFDITDLEKDKLKLVIGEKGISYLEYKKYVLLSKIVPFATAILGLVISFYTLFLELILILVFTLKKEYNNHIFGCIGFEFEVSFEL